MTATVPPQLEPSNCRECLRDRPVRFDAHGSELVSFQSKQIASKPPKSVRPIWTNPAGSNNSDRLPLAAEASSINGFESDSHPKSVMPSTSNAGNEYRDRKDSKDCGSRLGNFSSKMLSRDALSCSRIGTL